MLRYRYSCERTAVTCAAQSSFFQSLERPLLRRISVTIPEAVRYLRSLQYPA
ncbi:hypothetical protein [Moryella indoligenes]|uniref:hypothetical protein n=1 Tax=Moryella indoligenes TaxID=371674 RepID=UPI0027D7A54A|nr:hypothetical protein [Moryella indoligenes]